MASISYRFLDYANDPDGILPLIPTPVTTATTPVLVTLTSNGVFPILDPGAGVDGTLGVSIEGFSLGTLFDGDPGNGRFDHSHEGEQDVGISGPLRASIPTDVWAGIIADGAIQVDFAFGADVASTPDSFIRLDFQWPPVFQMTFGTDGYDGIEATGGPTSIHAMGGNDIIMGSAFRDQILAGDGNDIAFGGGGDDRVDGGSGNDEVSGSEGNDTVLGGSGHDAVWGDDGNDKLHGGDGLDTLVAGRGNDFLWGDADRDWLYGDDGTDRLWGGSGDDVLDGGKGTDYLWGGDGNDDLMGAAGSNHLFGGAGADRFIFQAQREATTQHVYDFDRGAGDQIVYAQGYDEVVDAVGIRAGKDGSVVSIGGLDIVVSGLFDLTVADITFVRGDEYPFL